MFWPHPGPAHTCSDSEKRRLAAGKIEEASAVSRQAGSASARGATDQEEEETLFGDDDDRIFDIAEEKNGEEIKDDDDCEPPCEHSRCYVWRPGVVLPTVPCKLDGVDGVLQCPQNET